MKSKPKDGIEKYGIAREFRKGCLACLSCAPVDVTASQDWKAGYDFAYSTLRPITTAGVQDYIVSLGYAPFNQIEVMRGKSKIIIADDISTWNGHEYSYCAFPPVPKFRGKRVRNNRR